MIRNLRFGLRILRRHPAFAVSAVSVMALGIGATTAVFSVIRGVLLTPLPYREPHRVVLFRADVPGYVHQPALMNIEVDALRERTELFESVAAINESDGNLTDPEHMEAVAAASIAENFLATLGVSPVLGRSVSRQDFGQRWVSGVNISYDLWQRRFAGAADVIGREIEVNNLPMRVVGVLPQDFRLYLGPGVPVSPRTDIWYPRPRGYDDDPYRGIILVARLRDGVSLETVQAATAAIATRLVAEHPSRYTTGPVRLSVSTVDQDVVSEVKPSLVAVAGAVAFVLLIACANLANLLLARASARTRELAVRISLGATRAQIVRQLAAEALLVGLIGAVGGILIAQWTVHGLLLLAPPALPQRDAIGIDAVVAAFAVVVSMFCALAVSLVPAWQATSGNVGGSLKQDPASSRRAATTRGVLAASQLALSLVLLVGAGLMGRAFVGLRSVPLGFEPQGALTMNIALQGQGFFTGNFDEARAKRLVFYNELARTVRQMPGVELAGVGAPPPLSGLSISQRFATAPGEPDRQAEAVIALAGYLEALRVPLVAGRYFTPDDDTQRVVIIDQQLAHELWPGQSAIGRRLLLPRVTSPTTVEHLSVEIVGVVAHVQTQGLRSSGPPQLWVTYATKAYSGLSLMIRGRNPMAFAPGVKDAVRRLGAGRPVHDVRLLQDYVADASADTRFALFVLGAFAALAMVLTAIGVYTVIAYATARRTREIAVRLALGAEPGRIVTLVMRQGVAWIAAGLITGIVAARLLTRFVGTLLFKVTETDTVTFVCVVAILGVVALAATLIPALRAMRIEPALALRTE